jgi:hypothetical protein
LQSIRGCAKLCGAGAAKQVGLTMPNAKYLGVGLWAVALLLGASIAEAQERRTTVTASAADGAGSKPYVRRKVRPLHVDIYGGRRRGGYARGAADFINANPRNPPPYRDVRQSPGGPFDTGFFFDSGVGGHGWEYGRESPYLH